MSYHLQPEKLPIEKYTEVYAIKSSDNMVVVRKFPGQGVSYIWQNARGRQIAWDISFKVFRKHFYKVGEL